MVYAKRVGDGERSMIQVVNKALLSFMTKWTFLCQSGVEPRVSLGPCLKGQGRVFYFKEDFMQFQEMILTLNKFWSDQGCIILQPYDIEKGAGTMNPATFLKGAWA